MPRIVVSNYKGRRTLGTYRMSWLKRSSIVVRHTAFLGTLILQHHTTSDIASPSGYISENAGSEGERRWE